MILVVDDSDVITTIVEAILRKHNKKCIVFNEPLLVKDVFDDEPEKYTHAIIDLLMPNMNGVELMRQLTEQNKDIKVLFFTGVSDATNVETFSQYAEVFCKNNLTELLEKKLVEFTNS